MSATSCSHPAEPRRLRTSRRSGPTRSMWGPWRPSNTSSWAPALRGCAAQVWPMPAVVLVLEKNDEISPNVRRQAHAQGGRGARARASRGRRLPALAHAQGAHRLVPGAGASQWSDPITAAAGRVQAAWARPPAPVRPAWPSHGSTSRRDPRSGRQEDPLAAPDRADGSSSVVRRALGLLPSRYFAPSSTSAGWPSSPLRLQRLACLPNGYFGSFRTRTTPDRRGRTSPVPPTAVRPYRRRRRWGSTGDTPYEGATIEVDHRASTSHLVGDAAGVARLTAEDLPGAGHGETAAGSWNRYPSPKTQAWLRLKRRRRGRRAWMSADPGPLLRRASHALPLPIDPATDLLLFPGLLTPRPRRDGAKPTRRMGD